MLTLTAFVHPDEQQLFSDFTDSYLTDLSPQSALEQTLATEIIHAAWRLRRCSEAESTTPAGPDTDLAALQTSIDRTRTAAQRAFHRSLTELRRLQSERLYRDIALPADLDRSHLGQANCRKIDPPAMLIKQVQAEDARLRQLMFESAKQTQSAAEPAPTTARNAPCPCGSGEKYKRCCGRTAPPVLTAPSYVSRAHAA